jgi:uncharacterized protein with HEPN domain
MHDLSAGEPITGEVAAAHALRHIATIAGFLGGVAREDFGTDLMRRFAVTLTLQYLSIASHWLPPDFTLAHPEIPWRDVYGWAEYYRHEMYPTPERIWADAHLAIGPMRMAFLQDRTAAQLREGEAAEN